MKTRTEHLETVAAMGKASSAVGDAARLVLILWGSTAAVLELFHHGISAATHDTAIHLYRLVDFSHLFETGDIFPRIAPNLGLGYGYATFTFYPPAAVYLGEVFHLFGLGYIASLKASFAVGVLVGGFGMYLLARDLYGVSGATAAALVYAYIPYRLLTVYVRGDVAECLALGLLPLAIWSVLRVCDVPIPSRIAFGGVAVAALVTSHVVTTLIATPIFAGMVIIRWATPRVDPPPRHDSWAPWFDNWLTISRQVLAIGLTAFLAAACSGVYWVPVLLSLPHNNASSLTQGFFDFHHWFISAGQLIQLEWLYDYQLIYEEGIRFNLGRVQAVLLTAAFLWILLGRPMARAILILCVALVALFVWMQQEGSATVWERVSLLRFVQFPHRLEGPIGVLSALLVGSFWSSSWYARARGRKTTKLAVNVALLANVVGKVGGIVGLIIFVHASLAHLPRGHEPLHEAEVNVPAMWRMEVDQKLIAGNTGGVFLPDTLTGDLFATPTPGPTELSDHPVARVIAQEIQPFRLIATTTAATASRLTFDRLAYPGWLVTVDGQVSPSQVVGPLGFLAIDVPAGEHRLTVWYDGAPGDKTGLGLTLAGITAILVVVLAPGSRDFLRRVGLVVVVGALVAGALATRIHPARQLGGAADFGGAVRLIGASLDQPANPPPGEIDLNLLWEAERAPGADCTVRVRLLDASGQVVARRDKIPEFGLRPCSTWKAGNVVHDLEQIRLPPGVPAGAFRLAIGLSVDGVDVPPTESTSVVAWHDSLDSGSPTRSGVDFGPVTVSAAPAETKLNGGKVVGATIDNTYRVASVRIRSTIDSGEADSADPRFVARLGPDDGLGVDILWRSVADARSDGAVFTQLLDASARLVAQDDGWPDHWYSPTSTWFPGDTLVDRRNLRPKTSLDPGLYHLVVGMYDRATMQRQPVAGPGADRDRILLGTVKVANANHVFGQPTTLTPKQTALGHDVALIGTRMESTALHPGDVARVDVGWRALAQPMTDFTVFVHLLNQSGQLVTQHDGPPLAGTFPTTAWDPGDTIYDQIDVPLPANLPPGTYSVVLGMYRADTGARLATASGEMTVSVGAIAVQ